MAQVAGTEEAESITLHAASLTATSTFRLRYDWAACLASFGQSGRVVSVGPGVEGMRKIVSGTEQKMFTVLDTFNGLARVELGLLPTVCVILVSPMARQVQAGATGNHYNVFFSPDFVVYTKETVTLEWETRLEPTLTATQVAWSDGGN